MKAEHTICSRCETDLRIRFDDGQMPCFVIEAVLNNRDGVLVFQGDEAELDRLIRTLVAVRELTKL